MAEEGRLMVVFKYLTYFGWLWGYLTCLVTWGVAVETVSGGYSLALLLLFNALLLTLLEVYTPLHEHAKILLSEDHWWLRVWNAIAVFCQNDVLKALLYTALGVLSCLQPRLWLAVLSGCFTLVLAVFSVLRYMNNRLKDDSETAQNRSPGQHYRRFNADPSPPTAPQIDLRSEEENIYSDTM